MNMQLERISAIRPDLVRRTGGGWLAISQNKGFFTIGVTGRTPDEATDKFSSSLRRWIEILKSGEDDVNT